MLTELNIRNFRIFEELTVEGLKRVNLIAGKNNTGKTALLEALRILAAGADSTVVNHILQQRGQFTPSWASSYEALFNRNHAGDTAGLQINELSIRKEKGSHGPELVYRVDIGSKVVNRQLNATDSPGFPKDQAVFVPFLGDSAPLAALWENIALTDLEDEVLNIIRETVEPGLIRLDVTGGNARVRLKGEPSPIPIQSLGDGVQRVLALVLALVNAKGKLLLIDEFEAGLHHSVQEKLWELTFDYAKKWDIQAFITTHSDDAVRTFYYAASRPAYAGEAFFMRLQFNRAGKLEAIPYDISRLENALELNLEIR